MAAKNRLTKYTTAKGKIIKVYAGARVSDALAEVTSDMTLYKGVRLAQLLEAFYSQGKKDGARQAFEAAGKAMRVAEQSVPHRVPGRPKKR